MALLPVSLPAAWSVPVAAGVPTLLGQSVAAGVRASASVTLATTLDDTLIGWADTQWGIFTSDNQPVVTSGRVRALDVQAGGTIATAPLENGSFLSYNKVRAPARYRVEMLCDGTSAGPGGAGMTDLLASAAALTGLSSGIGPSAALTIRRGFLQALDNLVADLGLYHVTTPETTYANVNVVGYSLRREAHRGVTLLWAELLLQEVRLGAGSIAGGTASPAGAPVQNGGTVQATDASQIEAATSGGFF
ncbi:hypothetical protein K2X14_10230 [Acetobacter sp. TBRC 12305]|uniref:Uncharacterized protein n=1 Tax=Acetobacter garciniae TaxID=2817435 RepID=A0A939HP84_9PROT|nr:hypothetical protein [Acetobacter garciniae]MBO1326046.1 hypothetical protein [Acetobacter garciniae]MBX0345210.1 hypothetical protein [Acetobacter garciniae]